MEKLDNTDWKIIALLNEDGRMASAEIARRAGIPEGTVRSRLKRGLDQLRERLDGTFGNRRAWALSLPEARQPPLPRSVRGQQAPLQ